MKSDQYKFPHYPEILSELKIDTESNSQLKIVRIMEIQFNLKCHLHAIRQAGVPGVMDLLILVSREKCGDPMAKRRAYYFRAITLSFM